MEYYPPPWIQVMSTEEIVGISPGHIVKCCQTFTQVKPRQMMKNGVIPLKLFTPSGIVKNAENADYFL